MTLILSNDDIASVLTMRETVDALERAYRELAAGEAVCRPRIDVRIPTSDPEKTYQWGTMEGGSVSGYFAIRMKSDIIYEQTYAGTRTQEKYCVRPGLYCGLIMLFDIENGEPLAIINDGYLQHMRVGADSAIGTKYMAREDAAVVGMIGSGGMARTYLQAFCNERRIDKVRVYSPTKEHRESYAAEMSDLLDIDVTPADDAESAVRGADIVATCTDSMRPVLKGAWLEPGMHVTNVGGFELDAEVGERATVAIRQGVSGLPIAEGTERVERGRGHSPVAYIAGTEEEMKRIPPAAERFAGDRRHATFAELASGAATGRTSADDITLYLNTGNQGLQFAAVGSVVYEKAKAAGLGRELPTEWFLQDIRD